MTRFLDDILRQPAALHRALEHLREEGREAIGFASRTVRQARHVYLTGIGASWNAALSAGALFYAGGHPVYLADASELLVSSRFPAGSVLIILSRSGDSIEIVKLLAKAREAGATVVGITNFAGSTLARESNIPVVMPVTPDHGISVNTYSTLALAAALLCVMAFGSRVPGLDSALAEGICAAEHCFPAWQTQLADTAWLLPGASYYFLGRGSSLASAHEARLLWEEGAKTPATSMGAGSFRHGPQESITAHLRVAIWIETTTRAQDLALARDLGKIGAHVLLIGHDIPQDAAELVCQVPLMPEGWQFLVDIFPAQLAAEHLAALAGEDCDSFRFASYIVHDDSGLGLSAETPAK